MLFHQSIRIAGSPDSEQPDLTPLIGKQNEKIHLISILAQVSNEDRTDMDNQIQGWLDKTKVFDIPAELIDTSDQNDYNTTIPLTAQRINEIPVDVELAPGEIFRVIVVSGAAATSFIGAYVFEVLT
jgi:hypothetical protein